MDSNIENYGQMGSGPEVCAHSTKEMCIGPYGYSYRCTACGKRTLNYPHPTMALDAFHMFTGESEKGAQRLLEAFGVDAGDQGSVERYSGDRDSAGGQGEKKWLVYVKTFTNIRLARAKDQDTSEMCRVKIQPSYNWIAGMRMKCMREDGDLFIHVGRSPRYRGKY